MQGWKGRAHREEKMRGVRLRRLASSTCSHFHSYHSQRTPSDDEDDDDEEEDYSEDGDVDNASDDDEGEEQSGSGDDGAAPPAKKKKKAAAAPAAKKKKGAAAKAKRSSRFIDDIAGVDESDDEDEDEGAEDDDLIAADDAAEVAQAEAAAAARAADVARAARERAAGTARDGGRPGSPAPLDIANMTAEELAAHLKGRYGGRAGDALEGGGAGAGPSAAPAALPTHDDPKLWVIETRTGMEREAVICIMQKAVDRAATGLPLQIKAAIAHDHLRGYIYLEAHKEAHVLDAVRGLRPCLGGKGTKMVPLAEMPDALAVTRESAASITPGAWVRIRAGAYRGDLARVADVDASAGRAQVRLVPRIDFAAKAAALARGGGPGPGRGAPASGAARPAPRGFALADAKAARLYVDKRKHPDGADGYSYYLDSGGGGGSSLGPFVDGYLLKDVSLKGLTLEAGVPPLDEVQRFAAVGAAARDAARAAAAELEDEDGGGGGQGTARLRAGGSELASLLEGASVAAAAGGGAGAASAYVKGDKVVVTAGDLAGLHGRVLGAAPGAGAGAVLVKPVGEFEDVEPQAIPAAHLAKHFEAGDHVKVTGGAHEGATGMVVRVDGPVCHVFSDAAREEVRVFARDLAESAEVAAGGLDALGQYELHDFVVLDAATVGVIVAVDKGVPGRSEERSLEREREREEGRSGVGGMGDTKKGRRPPPHFLTPFPPSHPARRRPRPHQPGRPGCARHPDRPPSGHQAQAAAPRDEHAGPGWQPGVRGRPGRRHGRRPPGGQGRHRQARLPAAPVHPLPGHSGARRLCVRARAAVRAEGGWGRGERWCCQACRLWRPAHEVPRPAPLRRGGIPSPTPGGRGRGWRGRRPALCAPVRGRARVPGRRRRPRARPVCQRRPGRPACHRRQGPPARLRRPCPVRQRHARPPGVGGRPADGHGGPGLPRQ